MTTATISTTRGELGGLCNRQSCANLDAQWFHLSTRRYYCRDCARQINRVNRSEALSLYGRDLCSLGNPLRYFNAGSRLGVVEFIPEHRAGDLAWVPARLTAGTGSWIRVSDVFDSREAAAAAAPATLLTNPTAVRSN